MKLDSPYFPLWQQRNSTVPTSSPLGFGAMSQQSDVSSLVQHLQGLTQQLTELEKLSLLSDTGKNLLSLCRQMTTTPSTAGPAEKKDTSGTSTYHPHYGSAGYQSALQRRLWEEATRSPSLGQLALSQNSIKSPTTHGPIENTGWWEQK